MGDKAAQRGDETAAAAPSDALTVPVTDKRDGTAIRHDDQLPALQEANGS
jgi:hypothetical protein